MNDRQRKQTGKFLLIAQVPVYLFSIFIFSQINPSKDTNSPENKIVEQYPNGKLNLDIPKPKEAREIDKLELMKKFYNDSVEEAKKNRKGDDFLQDFSKASSTDTKPVAMNSLQLKLDRITDEMGKEEKTKNNGSRQYGNAYSYEDFEREQKRNNDMAKLEKMTDKIIEEGNQAEIEELNDVNNTMDKLVKVMEMANAIENGSPLPGSNNNSNDEVIIYEATKPKGKFLDINTNGFNEISKKENDNIDNSFRASFFNQQTLTSGETVKLKLDEPMLINDVTIGENNFIYGKVTISNDRLVISITSIRYQNYLFPVSLQVYDYDGQKGIHVPGSVTREKGKQQASSSIRGLDFDINSFDQTLQTKAITTGGNLVKDVFAGKVKLVKVTVKPNHQVLIKNN